MLNRGTSASATLRRPLPTISPNQASTTISVTNEAVTLAGGGSGTTGTALLAFGPVSNSLGDSVGQKNDTSLVFGGTPLTTELTFQEALDRYFAAEANKQAPPPNIHEVADYTTTLNPGEYYVVYETGKVYYKKAAAGNATASYKYRGSSSISSGGTTSVVGNVASGAADSGNPVKIGLVYNSTPPTVTNGQRVDAQADSAGNLKTVEQNMSTAEDNSNGVIAYQNKPLAVPTYCWSLDASPALEASSVSKATAGVFRSISGRIDSTAGSGTYYIQLINAASLPADGAVTLVMAPLKIAHTTGTNSNFNLDATVNGVPFSTGLVWCISTTEFSKTITSAVVSANVLFK